MYRIINVIVVLFTLVGCDIEQRPSYEDRAYAELERQFMDCEADEDFDSLAYYKENRQVFIDRELITVSRFSEGSYDWRGVFRRRIVKADCVFESTR
jgi:hypothetical protein